MTLYNKGERGENLLSKRDRKQGFELQNRGRQDKSVESHFFEEVEKAGGKLRLKEGFLKKLARNDNTKKKFLGEDNKGNITDVESNVQRVKHKTAKALRYVVL
jgi:hypothetical protein